MKPILKLLECTNPGGMEKSAQVTMHALGEQGWRFRIASSQPMGAGEQALKRLDREARGFECRGLLGWRNSKTFRSHVRGLAKGTEGIWITGTDAVSLRAVLPLRQKKLLDCHCFPASARRSPLRWRGFYNLLCRQMDGVTYPTDYTRNEALKIAPWLRERSHVVRYGIEPIYSDEPDRQERRQLARLRLHLPEDAWIVGNAGGLSPRKNWEVFLKTAAEIAARIPGALFLVCGSAPGNERLWQLAREFGIQQKVIFTGEQEDMRAWYDAMDVLLFNSDFDTLPVTPCEAASRGCVVVASVTRGGVNEFLKNGRNGFLIEEHDPRELARMVVRTQQAPELAADLRAQAAEDLRERFSPNAAQRFYQDFFGSRPAAVSGSHRH